MSRLMRSDSSPFGPLTVTRSGSIAMVTPAGTRMGCLPMRDIASDGLPDLRHYFAPDALDAGVVAGHEPLGGRDDGRAHAALHPRDVGVVDVGALPRARDPLQARDHRLASLGVLERDRQLLAGAPGSRVMHVVVLDVALLAQDPGDLPPEPRGRDGHVVMLRGRRVAD